MKKMLSMMIALTCLFTLMAGFARADADAWHCETCDEERSSEWCPICGAHRPAAEPETWECPTCGEAVPMEYSFCPDDGTKKVVSTGTWPVKNLKGQATALKELDDESMRHPSFFGPNSKSYSGSGAYKPYKVTGMTALFREGRYVLVDMSYLTVGRRCVYFETASLTNTAVEAMSLNGHPAVTTAEVQPQFGPGYEYDAVVQKVVNKATETTKTRNVYVGAGTNVSVFFETNGWVFAEMSCSLGLIRAWLPAGTVAAK